MIRRPPRSTLFPTRRSSDLLLSGSPSGAMPFLLALLVSTTGGIVLCAYLNDQSVLDRKSTRLNSSHLGISYAVFCLKKKSARSCDEKKRRRSRSRYSRWVSS